MSKDGSLPIVEHFNTFQGEGNHSGRHCYFYRTYGCDQKCWFCDSSQTWSPEWKPDKTVQEMRMSVDEMVKNVLDARAPFVVITGGEPAIHDLVPLTDALQAHGIKVHIETSGAHTFTDKIDWITCSPKFSSFELSQQETVFRNLERADEWKLIIDEPGKIHWWWDRIAQYHRGQTIYLHPEWSHRNDTAILKEISEWILSHSEDFRAGLQMHKYFSVDLLDPNSDKRRIPLGGKIENGY